MNAAISAPQRAFEKAKITLIQSAGDLRTFYREWYELWITSGCSPFQSPMWQLPWIEHFTSDNLLALVFHLEGNLVGVAPLHRWREREQSTLLLVGNGISDF